MKYILACSLLIFSGYIAAEWYGPGDTIAYAGDWYYVGVNARYAGPFAEHETCASYMFAQAASNRKLLVEGCLKGHERGTYVATQLFTLDVAGTPVGGTRVFTINNANGQRIHVTSTRSDDPALQSLQQQGDWDWRQAARGGVHAVLTEVPIPSRAESP